MILDPEAQKSQDRRCVSIG